MGITDEAICLRLFPFSLRDKAKMLLNSLAPGTIWEALAQKFLAKYFSPAKTAKFRNNIIMFSQWENESFYKAWEHFKDLVKKCPHHDLRILLQIQTFYNSLGDMKRSMIYAIASETLMSKTLETAYALMEESTSNNYQWTWEWTKLKLEVRVFRAGSNEHHQCSICSLNKIFDNLEKRSMRAAKSIKCCGNCLWGERIHYDQVSMCGSQIH